MIRILLRCFSVLLPSWPLVLTHTNNEVLLPIDLEGGFRQEILEAIGPGIPITI
jgi:hypothetical protein